MVAADSEDPEKEAEELLNELRLYSSFLAEKPKIFVMTKIDMVPADELKIPKGWHGISSVTRTGTDELIVKLNDLIESIKEPEVRNIVI